MNNNVIPRFSIVTIVRNNTDGLEQTRASVQAQDFVLYEWVIIDGASSDGTAEFVAKLGQEGARVLSEPDSGIYNAMNKGLLRARGDYVLLMNAGDCFAAPTVLTKIAGALKTAREPDVLFGGSVMQFPGRRISRPAKPISYIWHGQPGLHQATVFSRTNHQQFPYDESFRITGDYDVITRMWAAKKRFEICDVTISVNSFDARSISGRNKRLLMAEAVRCQRQNLRLNALMIAASLARRGAASLVAKLLGASRA